MSKTEKHLKQAYSKNILPCCDLYAFKHTLLDERCKKELDLFLVYISEREPIKENEIYEKRIEEIRRKLMTDKYNNLYHVIDSVIEFRKCDNVFTDKIYSLLEKFFPKDSYTKLINLEEGCEETDG